MKAHFEQEIQSFLDRELPDEDQQKIGEHLMVCGVCRELHDELRFGKELASELEAEDAPAGVWNRVEAAVKGSGVPAPSSRHYIRPILAFGVAVIAMLLFVPVYLILISPADEEISNTGVTPNGKFQVEKLSGSPRVSGEPDSFNLAVGDVLETDGTSSARIKVADIGKVDVSPNSKVKLLKSGEKEHRLALERGVMKAEIVAPPRLFIVDTPSATAVDLGCAYTLEVTEDGTSRLHVTSGYVALETDGLESLVPAGAFCESRKGGKLGTPFFGDASERLKRSLADFDFRKGGSDSVEAVIRESTRKDTLTLWHLLPKVDEGLRAQIVARIVHELELDDGVTADGLIRLDDRMMMELRNDLEVLWYEQPGWFE